MQVILKPRVTSSSLSLLLFYINIVCVCIYINLLRKIVEILVGKIISRKYTNKHIEQRLKEDSTSGTLSLQQRQRHSTSHCSESQTTFQSLYNVTGLQTGSYIYLIGLVCEERGEILTGQN